MKLHSIDHRILKTLIDFIYTGKIEIDQINGQELLAAADMLQLPDVVTGCAQYFVSGASSIQRAGNPSIRRSAQLQGARGERQRLHQLPLPRGVRTRRDPGGVAADAVAKRS